MGESAGMRRFVTVPIRAGRHLAIWLVWQSTGITLVRYQPRPFQMGAGAGFSHTPPSRLVRHD
jgi:hypothetical protein